MFIISHPLLLSGGIDDALTDNADSIFVGSTIRKIVVIDIVVGCTLSSFILSFFVIIE